VIRPRILVTRPPWTGHLERLEAVGDVTLMDPHQPPTEAGLAAALPGHQALVCMLTDPVTAEVIHGADGLRLISQIAVGLDNVDVAAATEAGVLVCHTPGVLTDATADLAMALLLAVCRRVVESDALVRRGEWGVWSLPWMTGLELRGATLGIFGMGRIGTAVARRARAFGMRVVYCNRSAVDDAVAEELHAERVDFYALLRRSDVISLHAPATDETRHAFDADALARMKPGSRLINTARGSLVDEDALAAALDDGPLVGVGLDVYEAEPHVPASLIDRPDVVLLPHTGSATEATRARMSDLAVSAVEEWIAGRTPENVFRG